jgi:dodecin
LIIVKKDITFEVHKFKIYKMAVLKVIEVLSSSTKSWEDATNNAVMEASKTIKDISSVYVQDMSTTVKDGKVDEYRVNVKITFRINR